MFSSFKVSIGECRLCWHLCACAFGPAAVAQRVVIIASFMYSAGSRMLLK